MIGVSSLNKGHPDDPPHKKSLWKCAVQLFETERPVVLVPPAPSREIRVAIDTIGKMVESHDCDGPRQSDDAFKASPKASTYMGDPGVFLLFDVRCRQVLTLYKINTFNCVRFRFQGESLEISERHCRCDQIFTNTRQNHR